jgi:hypothetical protein
MSTEKSQQTDREIFIAALDTVGPIVARLSLIECEATVGFCIEKMSKHYSPERMAELTRHYADRVVRRLSN